MRDPLPRPQSPAARATPPIRVVPANVIASPADLHAAHNPAEHPPLDREMWWTPGWRDVARAIGWWWLLLAPILTILLAAAIVPLLMGWWGVVFSGIAFWIKTGVFLAAVAIAIVATAMARATSYRKDPFCIHCGYGLAGLDDHGDCPECGRPYSRGMWEEYRRDPAFFRERYRTARLPPPNSTPFHAGLHASEQAADGT